MFSRIWHSLFATIVIFVVAVNVFASSNELSIYKSKEKGFSISFPSTWETREASGGMEVTAVSPPQDKSADPLRPKVTLGVEVLPQKTTLDDYARLRLEKTRGLVTDFQIHKTGRQTISHTQARWWVISYRVDTATVKGFMHIVIKDNRAFTITCVAPLDKYATYKDKFADIAASLMIE